MMDIYHLILVVLASHTLSNIWFRQPVAKPFKWALEKIPYPYTMVMVQGQPTRVAWGNYMANCIACMGFWTTVTAVAFALYIPALLYLFAAYEVLSLYREYVVEVWIVPQVAAQREKEAMRSHAGSGAKKAA